MNNIEDLVKRFYDGDLSDQETERLRQLLNANSKEIGFAEVREYLNFLDEKRPSVRDEETVGSVLGSLTYESSSPRRWLLPYLGAAAAIALLISFVVIRVNGDTNPQVEIAQVDTFEDPQEAYEEVKKALQLVSNEMNDGASALAQLEIVQNTLEPIEIPQSTNQK